MCWDGFFGFVGRAEEVDALGPCLAFLARDARWLFQSELSGRSDLFLLPDYQPPPNP